MSNSFTQLQRYGKFGVVTSLVLGVAIAFSNNCALAEITPDNTLSGENSVVTPNILINGLPADRIDGGAIRGAHLFHSFAQFNVQNGQRVYFANPVGIENILSRVTGTDLSDILGTLGVDGGANLFLLNPNGIMFGPNAELDIRGSFLGSTADSLVFGNSSEFSATNPNAPPLLTINVPIGLQYGSNHPGATIANRGSLVVGEDLTLAAGNLDLQGQLLAERDLTLQAQDTVRIRDSAVEPFIAAARGKLLVQGNQEVDIFVLNHPDSGFFSAGDLVLRSANAVGGDAHYWTGGSFRIEQLDGSIGDLFSPYDPIVRASGDVSFNSYVGTSLHILAGGSVTIPGFVIITNFETGTPDIDYLEEEITLSNGDRVRINGMMEPTLDIRAGVDQGVVIASPPVTGQDFLVDFFNLDPFDQPDTTNNPTSADITIGTIAFSQGTDVPDNLLAGKALLTNQYQPNLSLTGDIEISATLNLLPNVAIQTGEMAGGGTVAIDSRGSITLDGIVNTSAIPGGNTFNGNGGDVTLLAEDDITFLPGSSIISAGLLGGQITLNSGSSLLINDSAISSITAGVEEGGNLTVNAADSLEILNNTGLASTNLLGLFNIIGLDGSDLAVLIEEFSATGIASTTLGAGKSGDITINTNRLIIRNNQLASDILTGVSTATLQGSSGNGGNIEVNASDLVEIIGNQPGPFSAGLSDETARMVLSITTGITTATNSSGNAGNLAINTGRLIIRDGAGASSGNGIAGTGEGGNLRVSATESIELEGLAALATGSFGPGNAGELIVEAPTAQVTLRDGAGISTDTLGLGDAATLTINAAELTILDGSRIGAATTAQGSGATININADLVEVAGTNGDGTVPSGLFTSAIPGATGAAGDLNIDANRLVVRDGGRVSANTDGTGNAGDLKITTERLTVQNGGRVSASTDGTGDAGDLKITTERLTVQNGGRVSASTSDAGQGGILDVRASELVEVVGTSADDSVPSGLFTSATSGSTGAAGNLNIGTRRLLVRDGGRVSASTDGTGNAGDLKITTERLTVQNGGRVSASTSDAGQGGVLDVNASELVEVIGTSADGQISSSLFFDASGTGDAGDLKITTERLTVRDGGRVSASTSDAGRGGTLDVNASEVVEVIGTSADGQISSSLFFDASGTGDAGDLKITTERLTVRDGGRVSASTSDAGRGGTLDVNASESVEVIGTSANGQISSSLFFDASGTGDAGDLKITTERLTVRDGGRVSASTSDAGRGGTLDVNASESVEVIGTSADGRTPSRLFFDSSGAGDAGELAIATKRLVVQDGGQVSASASGDGNAGILALNASESVEVIGTSADGRTPSRLFFDSSGAGDAGELAIATRRLVVQDGGQVSAATSATGRGGILEVNASESIEVSGSSGSFASGLFFDSRGAGDARGIKIDTGNLVVENRGQITVSGTGTGIFGDLEIKADSIFLNNQGRLRATTAASEGGNIRLQVANSIIMRHNSEISAEAFGTAKGGNITMEVGDFIIALLPENSDIVASAFEGQGGNISAKATGIFGFRQFQGVRTPESDFTATSELGIDGTLEVITRDNLRLEGLSDDFLNDKDQPTQGCQAFGSRSSAKFYNLGRGGLPTNPYEPLGSNDILEDVQPPTQGSENSAEADTSFTTPPETIVEAQGWMITDKGEVILVAQMPVPLSQNFCQLR